MLEQFLNHLERHHLCKTTDKILLAVSGGLDSMVMLNLFKQAGIRFGIAHCNFQLRGEDSKADEALVNNAAVEAHAPFHLKRFDTARIAEQRGISIQMAARELRYQFFEEIRSSHDYQFVATAHHVNDSLETVLLNLIRGTGIDGLTGIPVRQGNIIRPLLFATRNSLEAYATFLRLQWREDISNQSDAYPRNMIRNKVMPLLRELNPSVEQTYITTQERLTGAAFFSAEYVHEITKQTKQKEGERLLIQIDPIFQHKHGAVLLWMLIREFDFSYLQCRQIITITQSGKKILSATHVLVRDRKHLIVYPRQKQDRQVAVSIDSETASVQLHASTMTLESVAKADFETDTSVAIVDANRVRFPLTWRKWQEGDAFKPLGMNQSKKISDFLIDMKISLPQKESVTVLESAGQIIWVVGMRISHEVRVTPDSSHFLKLVVRQNAGEIIS